MINSIKTFYNDIARKKAFWLPVLLFTLLAYGFSLTRNTLSIDDMSLDFYGGIRGAIVASGRWGMEVWHKLLGINGYSPYIYKFFGVLFLLAAAFLMCCIFYNLKPSYSSKVYPYTFFASIIITFPLINEIWEYNGANAVVGANLFVVFLSILYILFSEQKLWIKFLISGLMMSVVVSSYESALFVYITAVMCVLFYRYCVLREKNKAYSWLLDGLKFIPTIAIAVVLRFAVSFVWLKALHITPMKLGATSLGWKDFTFQKIINVTQYILDNYLLKFGYLPALLLFAALIAFVIYFIYRTIRNRSVLPVLIGVIAVMSIFLLSYIQLKTFMYRTAQTVNFSVAFIVFLLALSAQSFDKKWINIAVVAVLALVTVYQATYLSRMLELNNQRSENEIAVVHQLGMELTRDYKKDNKEIVFCGRYDTGEYIRDNLEYKDKKVTNSNHKSLLTWSATAFQRYKQVNVMKKLFSYCGYDLNISRRFNKRETNDLAKQAKKNGMNPLEIRDMGDYVLVYLG